MALTVASCGEDTATDAPSKESEKPASVEEVSEAPSQDSAKFQPVSKTIGDYDVSVIAFEDFDDHEDNAAMRIYYEFTNTSEETTYASSELTFYAKQDGYELAYTFAGFEEDVPEYAIDSCDVRPGVTVRCVEEFSYKRDGGEIVVTIEDFWSDETIEINLTPDMFNGRPAEDFEIKAIDNPTWTDDLAYEGQISDEYSVSIGDAETFEDEGDQIIRVYFTFTNNSDVAVSPFMAITLEAFQDGVELETAMLLWDNIEADDAYSEDVQPGATVTAAETFILRSDSMVEVEVSEFLSEIILGAKFNIQ